MDGVGGAIRQGDDGGVGHAYGQDLDGGVRVRVRVGVRWLGDRGQGQGQDAYGQDLDGAVLPEMRLLFLGKPQRWRGEL